MIFIDCCLKSNYIFIDSLNSLITVFHSGSCWNTLIRWVALLLFERKQVVIPMGSTKKIKRSSSNSLMPTFKKRTGNVYQNLCGKINFIHKPK